MQIKNALKFKKPKCIPTNNYYGKTGYLIEGLCT